MKYNKPYVSIFIPTFNDRTDLYGCIESICSLDYPKNRMEVMVWDNGSEDGSDRMVRDRFKEMESDRWLNLKLIEWNRNEGSYIPYNLAVPYFSSDTQYIFGLDADVELSLDALSIMVEAAEEDDVAVVGGRSVYFDHPDKTSHGAGFVDRWTALLSEKDARGQIKCDYVIGCCWLLKRRVFDRLGGFAPDYYINHWEVDYCVRAKQNGYKIIYEPGAIAKHKIQMHGTVTPERIYYLYRNKLLLVRKNQMFFRLPWALFSCVGTSVAKLPFLSITRMTWMQTRAALKGIFDGIRGITGQTFRRD